MNIFDDSTFTAGSAAATNTASIGNLHEGMRKIREIQAMFPRTVVVTHPDNMPWLLGSLRAAARQRPKATFNGVIIDPLNAFDIQENSHLPRFASRWEFPKNWSSRFIQYEPSDEAWARPLGYGREVETNDPLVLMVDEKLFWPDFNAFFRQSFGIPKEVAHA